MKRTTFAVAKQAAKRARWISPGAIAFVSILSSLSISQNAFASDADDIAIATGKPDPLNSAVQQPTGKAGWYDGLFFLRDSSDNFRLYVQGRVHVDFNSYFGPGLGSLPPGAELKTGVSLRRVRPELSGEFFHRWQWQLSAELGGTASDNVGGTTDTSSCSPDGNGALVCMNQSAAVESASVKPAPTDAFINYIAHPLLNVQVGQFLLPFSFENRMSDNTTPFTERNIVVRNIGAPNLRDIGAMVWGEPENRLFYYSVGIFNGDGPNRLNADSRFDVFSRAFIRPFATRGHGSIRDLHIGASARGGSRDSRLVGYDMPSMTTEGGYAFWKPTYRDSTARLVHILPSTTQEAFAADVYAPIGPIDATAEITYASGDTREAVDGFQLQNQNLRRGDLSGIGWYGQLGLWVLGRSQHDRISFVRKTDACRPRQAAAESRRECGAAPREIRAAARRLFRKFTRRRERFQNTERRRKCRRFRARRNVLGDQARSRFGELRVLRFLRSRAVARHGSHREGRRQREIRRSHAA